MPEKDGGFVIDESEGRIDLSKVKPLPDDVELGEIENFCDECEKELGLKGEIAATEAKESVEKEWVNGVYIEKSFPGHAGRPGQRGGSVPRGEGGGDDDILAHTLSELEQNDLLTEWRALRTHTLYHGTTKQALTHIRKEGLIPGKGHGADEAAGNFFVDMGEGRDASIYMTTSPKVAQWFATFTAKELHAKPVVLEIKMPKKLYSQAVRDEEFGARTGVRLKGAIPAKYIKVRSLTKQDDTDTVTFYAVLICDEE